LVLFRQDLVVVITDVVITDVVITDVVITVPAGPGHEFQTGESGVGE
jgi:hypothetical protein